MPGSLRKFLRGITSRTRLPAGGRSGGEQCGGDFAPFLVEWEGGNGAARVAIPVTGILEVTFAAVEVGVDPGGVAGVDLLGNFVGAGPAAFGIPPESFDERGQLGRRAGQV